MAKEKKRGKTAQLDFYTYAPDSIISVDYTGLITEWNPAAEKTFGHSREEAVGKKMAELIIPPSLREQHHRGWQHFMKTGDGPIMGKSIEITALRANGTEFPAGLTVTTTQVRGKPYFTAYLQDISTRKQNENTLRRQEHILSSTTDLMALLDRDFIYLAANKAYLKAFNKNSTELIGHSVAQVLGKDFFKTAIEPNANRCLAGDSINYKSWIDFPGSGSKYMDVNYYPYINGGVVEGFVVNARDITSQKYVEEDLEKQHHSLENLVRERTEELNRAHKEHRALVDTIEGIVWEADARTFQFTFVSQQAERLLGHPTRQWLNEEGFWAKHIHPEDRDWAVNLCIQATKDMRDHEFEYRMIAADGSTVWLRDLVTVVSENGQPTRLRGVMVDISESKRIEKIKLEAEKMAALQRLSLVLTHDLRGPMTGIRKALDLLRRELQGVSSGMAHRLLDDMVLGSDLLLGTLSDLLDVHCHGLSAIPLRQKPFALDRAVQAVLPFLQAEIENKGIRLDIQMGTPKPRVNADLRRIQRVIFNIMENAVRYSPPGSCVTARCNGNEDHQVLITVEDEGPGIPNENLNRIFDLMASDSPDQDSRTDVQGTGVGLYFCRITVEAHGGRIWAENRLEGGARINLTLPLADR